MSIWNLFNIKVSILFLTIYICRIYYIIVIDLFYIVCEYAFCRNLFNGLYVRFIFFNFCRFARICPRIHVYSCHFVAVVYVIIKLYTLPPQPLEDNTPQYAVLAQRGEGMHQRQNSIRMGSFPV